MLLLKYVTMFRTPCENIVWNGLPILRKEIARVMIKDFNLNEKETAKMLGISAAAVSQYLSGKRGKIDIIDKNLLNEIKISTEKIIKEGDVAFITEVCRLCNIFRSKGIFTFEE